MINIATEITSSHDCDGIAVISGIGVTGYYKKLGFEDKGDYLVKQINDDEMEIMIVSSIMIVIVLTVLIFMMFNTLF